jgi:hypothetical protein
MGVSNSRRECARADSFREGMTNLPAVFLIFDLEDRCDQFSKPDQQRPAFSGRRLSDSTDRLDNRLVCVPFPETKNQIQLFPKSEPQVRRVRGPLGWHGVRHSGSNEGAKIWGVRSDNRRPQDLRSAR